MAYPQFSESARVSITRFMEEHPVALVTGLISS